MKISVITVCFNSKKTIENTIKSVIGQSYSDIEYIVIDGGSTDGTVDLIKRYKEKISIIKSEPDKGIYDAINKGISLASGKIISILHSNDIFYDEQTLTKVHKYFNDHSDLKVLLSDIAFKKNLMKKNTLRYYSSKSFKPWMLRIGFSPPHTSSFITKQTYEKIGFYDTSFKIAGDFEFFIRCFLKERTSYMISNQCSVIMSPGGLSGRNYKSYLISSLEINKALKENGFYSNILLTFIRFPLKLIQFLVK